MSVHHVSWRSKFSILTAPTNPTIHCPQEASSFLPLRGNDFDVCLLNPFSWDRRDDKHYASDEEVKTVVLRWLKEQSAEFYAARIHALI